MYYAAFTDPRGERKQGIYTSEELHRITFSPDAVTCFLSGLKPQNKADARQLVIDIMNADAETVDGGGECMSWNEWAILGGLFEKWARRFGLVHEFRKNGIL